MGMARTQSVTTILPYLGTRVTRMSVQCWAEGRVRPVVMGWDWTKVIATVFSI